MNKTKQVLQVYLLYHHLEANVLKADQFPFTHTKKIMITTTDQTQSNRQSHATLVKAKYSRSCFNFM